MIKYCKDCKWFDSGDNEDYCRHEKSVDRVDGIDLVWGNSVYRTAKEMRINGDCTKQGLLFTPLSGFIPDTTIHPDLLLRK